MAVYIITYDLNGKTPNHTEMDEHIAKQSWRSGRILETVWLVETDFPIERVYDIISIILSDNDSIFVGNMNSFKSENLLISDEDIKDIVVHSGMFDV